MVTKEKIKREVDKLPETLLDEVYALLQQVKRERAKPLLPRAKEAATRVKAKRQSFLNELKEAVEQVKLAKRGKVKLKSAEELLNEL